MWFLKLFAIIVPILILWSILTGEIAIMSQLNKTHSNITFNGNPIGFVFSIGFLIVLEFYLIKTVHSSNDSNE